MERFFVIHQPKNILNATMLPLRHARTVRKPLARKGAWALFRDVWTYGGKVNEFLKFFYE